MGPVITTPEEPKGKVIATYLVRVTLRENPPSADYAGLGEPDIPTNDRLAELLADQLFHETDYFTREAIHVASERTDI
jgi:hypothetical protein